MVEFYPFKGFIYNIGKVKNISNVVSPPWDMINDKIEKGLLSLSDFNIVKLIYKENCPEEVNKIFNNWIEEKVLIEEEKEYFYFLKGNFEYEGTLYRRSGIFGILKVEDFDKGNIIPHEKIFQKYSDNRYKLLEICKANFCPIFMLYKDKNFEIEEMVEKYEILYKGNINSENFEFGRIERKQDIEKIKDFFKKKIIFIADGHHRYLASLNFYKNNPEEKNSFVLVYMANILSEGVLILPTHRYIPSEVQINFDKNFIETFKVKDLKEIECNLKNNGREKRIGMYYEGDFYLLKIRNIVNFLEDDPILKRIDTYILDNFIIKNFVKMSENVEFVYHSSKEYLLEEYKNKGKGVIFFLNPVEKEIFVKVCLKRKIMPPKSTHFYPKVPSGLIIYKF
jgi:uncharacterized protein (DUF1015 family)